MLAMLCFMESHQPAWGSEASAAWDRSLLHTKWATFAFQVRCMWLRIMLCHWKWWQSLWISVLVDHGLLCFCYIYCPEALSLVVWQLRKHPVTTGALPSKSHPGTFPLEQFVPFLQASRCTTLLKVYSFHFPCRWHCAFSRAALQVAAWVLSLSCCTLAWGAPSSPALVFISNPDTHSSAPYVLGSLFSKLILCGLGVAQHSFASGTLVAQVLGVMVTCMDRSGFGLCME